MTNSPLISCLCVTHKKPDLLIRAVHCFYTQSYSNKQLVIVYEEKDSKITLGELRNISIKKVDGTFVYQWDDDDWYSPERLSKQMQYLQLYEKPASILSKWIVFNSCSPKAFMSNHRPWEGSIL